MATRVYCDHCGCTISGKSPNKFSFGPKNQYDAYDLAKQQMMIQSYPPYYGNGGYAGAGGAGGGGGNILGGPYTTGIINNPMTMAMPGPGVTTSSNSVSVETIDLCDRCVTIWMERVRKLCRASDPDKVNSEA